MASIKARPSGPTISDKRLCLPHPAFSNIIPPKIRQQLYFRSYDKPMKIICQHKFIFFDIKLIAFFFNYLLHKCYILVIDFILYYYFLWERKMNHSDTKNTRLARAAYLYFIKGKNQQEIAKATGVTRTLVSRMLNEARKKNIVTISVRYPWRSLEMELALKSVTGLKDARVIIPNPGDSDVQLQNDLGIAAAEYFDQHIQNGHTIGISWGTSLHHMVEHLLPKSLPDCKVVQLIGATGSEAKPLDGPMLARLLASHLGCDVFPLHTPLLVENAIVRDGLIHDKTIQETLKKGESADFSWVGIGSPLSGAYSLVREGYLSQKEMQTLIEAGVVGDVCAQLYDINGKVLEDLEINKRTVGITLPSLQKSSCVVGVSGGYIKKDAVLGAIRGSHIKVLITDKTVAEYILKSF
jgi:DNA-binding transcriptional regulator LsrR (DeoR family)